MPGKVRVLDRGIHLNDSLRAQVDYLARLAGVTPSDIVNFVLTEVFEGEDGQPDPERLPPAPLRRQATGRPPKRPADVISIGRRYRPVAPAHQNAEDHRDRQYLRRQAATLREAARVARARASQACARAHGARERAVRLLHRAYVL